MKTSGCVPSPNTVELSLHFLELGPVKNRVFLDEYLAASARRDSPRIGRVTPHGHGEVEVRQRITSSCLPGQYGSLQVQNALPDSVESFFVNFFPESRRDNPALQSGVANVALGELDGRNRPSPVAEDQALLSIITVLNVSCGKSLPLIGGQVNRLLAAQNLLATSRSTSVET